MADIGTDYEDVFGSDIANDQYKLARKLEKGGGGMEKNPQLAASLYIMAAESGHKNAANIFATDLVFKNRMKKKEDRINVIIAAVNEGYAPAQCCMAARYLHGLSVEKDVNKALTLFTDAAEQGHLDAQYYLGMMYINGVATEKDTNKGLELIVKSAEKGSKVAQYNLGLFYSQGIIVDKNEKIAFKWSLESAIQNYMPAQTRVAKMYMNGVGTKCSHVESVKWFGEAARRGNNSAWFLMGQMYEKGDADLKQSLGKAVDCYLSGKKHGCAKCTYRLAEMHEKGLYYESDPKVAYTLYKQAEVMGVKKAKKKAEIMMVNPKTTAWKKEINSTKVDDNNNDCIKTMIGDDYFLKTLNYATPSDQFKLGQMLETGKNNVVKDLNQAAMLYIRAAEGGNQNAIDVFKFNFNYKNKMAVTKDRFEVIKIAAEMGYVHAQYSIGGRYRRGINVVKNYDLAFEWFTKAAEQGHADAQFYLGTMYRKGRGVEKDDKKADALLESAASNGCPEAQHQIGKKYDNGIGVEKDPIIAFKWYLASAENGYHMSVYRIGEMYRDGTGVEHSSEKAIEWFLKSANKGYRIAWFTIGQMYEKGYDDLKQDFDTALKYYHIAEKRGYCEATYHIAKMYENGIYFDRDLKKALELYKECSLSGYKAAEAKIKMLSSEVVSQNDTK